MPGANGLQLLSSSCDSSELEKLASRFRLECLYLPPECSDAAFDSISLTVRERLHNLAHESVPTVLIGESFGSLIALAAALDSPSRDCIRSIVLINPATSVSRSLTPLALSFLPSEALSFGTASSLAPPVLGDASLLTSLNANAIRHRLQLMLAAANPLRSRVHQLRIPTVLVAGQEDRFLPSDDETHQLERIIQRNGGCAERIKVDGGDHALVETASGALSDILLNRSEFIAQVLEESKRNHAISQEASLRISNDPEYQLPGSYTFSEARNAVWRLRDLLGARFFSTHRSGEVVEGLDALQDERPMIICGNHQTLAVDLVLIVAEVLERRDMLLRGVAHPSLYNMGSENRALLPRFGLPAFEAGPESEREGARPLRAFFQAMAGDSRQFEQLLSAFGSVRVGKRNLFNLLQRQEAVLLYPGGVSEAGSDTRGGQSKYKLQWPSDPSFVSLAAKFNATIVPFGAVGLEDNLTTVFSREEQLESPIGGILKWFLKETPRVYEEEKLWPPLALPNPFAAVERMYVRFGAPIRTDCISHRDKEAMQNVYERTKSSVEEQIEWLIAKRENDTYRKGSRRFIYEAINGRNSAPTFEP